MTKEISESIAKDFVKSQNTMLSANESFKYGIGEMTEFPVCYYFDFPLLNSDGGKYTESPIAGAPGFTISKTDHHVRLITMSKLHDLQKSNI